MRIRNCFRFSLRTFILLVTAFLLAVNYFASAARTYEAEQAALEKITRDVTILYPESKRITLISAD